jgi:uncharacterized protein (TIGR02391 family)
VNLAQVFPNPEDLLRLPPEDLAGVIMEIADPGNARISMIAFVNGCRQPPGRTEGYPHAVMRLVTIAIAEAFNWLLSQGIIIHDPEQHADFHLITRRGAQLRSREAVRGYRQASVLPRDLLHPVIAERVWPLFARGDYETAVFQAYKEVEVAVRSAGGYSDQQLGVDLMRKAFHPDTGPLRDPNAIPGERQAVSDLFAGVIGYGKNPASHRHVEHGPKEAAKLIIFASYLLDVVEDRRQAATSTS